MNLTALQISRAFWRRPTLSPRVMFAAAGLIMATAVTPAATAGSLFGDPACESWPAMDIEARRTWTLAFLAPLSMAYETRQKTGEDKFNYKAEAAERAMTSIDGFCTANPAQTAADGAAAHLESLVGTR